VHARDRAGLRNAIAHGAGADDAYCLDIHIVKPLQSETDPGIVSAFARGFE
jgi:hypothetical protein